MGEPFELPKERAKGMRRRADARQSHRKPRSTGLGEKVKLTVVRKKYIIR